MYFKDIIGQEEVKERLRQSARTGIVPHAQLFTEQGGAGAFPLALAYARYLNCTNRTDTDACGRCPSCLKYDELAHPDLHFVFPIVAKKEKKKEVCDDYLSEWRGFLKEHPYFNMDEWLDYIEAGNSQAIIYSKESDEIIHKLSLKIYEAEYRILMVWLPETSYLRQQASENHRGASYENGYPYGIRDTGPYPRDHPIPCATHPHPSH